MAKTKSKTKSKSKGKAKGVSAAHLAKMQAGAARARAAKAAAKANPSNGNGKNGKNGNGKNGSKSADSPASAAAQMNAAVEAANAVAADIAANAPSDAVAAGVMVSATAIGEAAVAAANEVRRKGRPPGKMTDEAKAKMAQTRAANEAARAAAAINAGMPAGQVAAAQAAEAVQQRAGRPTNAARVARLMAENPGMTEEAARERLKLKPAVAAAATAAATAATVAGATGMVPVTVPAARPMSPAQAAAAALYSFDPTSRFTGFEAIAAGKRRSISQYRGGEAIARAKSAIEYCVDDFDGGCLGELEIRNEMAYTMGEGAVSADPQVMATRAGETLWLERSRRAAAGRKQRAFKGVTISGPTSAMTGAMTAAALMGSTGVTMPTPGASVNPMTVRSSPQGFISPAEGSATVAQVDALLRNIMRGTR